MLKRHLPGEREGELGADFIYFVEKFKGLAVQSRGQDCQDARRMHPDSTPGVCRDLDGTAKSNAEG